MDFNDYWELLLQKDHLQDVGSGAGGSFSLIAWLCFCLVNFYIIVSVVCDWVCAHAEDMSLLTCQSPGPDQKSSGWMDASEWMMDQDKRLRMDKHTTWKWACPAAEASGSPHLIRGVFCEARAQWTSHSSGVFWRMTMLRTRELQLFALLVPLLLRESSSAVQNDATESGSLQPDLQSQNQTGDEDSNQARNGGRQPDEPVRNGESKLRIWLQVSITATQDLLRNMKC